MGRIYTARALPVSGGFADPRDFGNLAAWWRADQGLTLVSTKVSTWTDLSGRALAPTQATDAQRPTYVPALSTLGNRPTTLWSAAASTSLVDAVNDITTTSSARTIFIVCRATDAVGGTIVNFNRGATDYAYQWYHTAGLRFAFGDSVNNITLAAPPTMQDTSYRLTYSQAGTGATFTARANGVAYTPSATAFVESAGTGYAMGIRPSYGQGFTGYISEIIVYSDAKPQSVILTVEDYLRGLYF